jgi:hypothetical protein
MVTKLSDYWKLRIQARHVSVEFRGNRFQNRCTWTMNLGPSLIRLYKITWQQKQLSNTRMQLQQNTACRLMIKSGKPLLNSSRYPRVQRITRRDRKVSRLNSHLWHSALRRTRLWWTCNDMLLHVQARLQLIPLLQSFVVSVQRQWLFHVSIERGPRAQNNARR